MSSIKDFMLIVKDVSHIAADLVKVQTEHFTNLYRNIMTRLLAWLVVVLSAITLAIGGLGMILFAVYMQLSSLANPIVSAYILGAFLVLLALIVFLIARNMLKD